MSRALTVLKSVGPKLVPFLKTSTIYFVLYGAEKGASLMATLVKCAPIISLVAFVLMHGMNFSQYYTYSRRILMGLLFSCVGDSLLVWSDYGFFIYGMIAFGIAHLFYAFAFGFQPFGWVSCAVTVFLGFFFHNMMSPGLRGIMIYAVPVYIGLLWLMTWRSLARIKLFESTCSWATLVGVVGASLFVVSDVVLGYEKFRSKLPYGHQITMATYYLGQMGIALSVVDSQTDTTLGISVHKTRANKAKSQ